MDISYLMGDYAPRISIQAANLEEGALGTTGPQMGTGGRWGHPGQPLLCTAHPHRSSNLSKAT